MIIGIQKWTGGIPILIINLANIIKNLILDWKEVINVIVIEIIIKKDEITWMKKNKKLIFLLLRLIDKRVINKKFLISNINHIIIRSLDRVVIKVTIIINKIINLLWKVKK